LSNCCDRNGIELHAARCPQSGSAGSAVGLQTLKALLRETALGRVEPSPYRFCADPGCDVVYFNAAGACFGSGDLRVPVWQTLPFGGRPLCYCFGESEASIRAEIGSAGRSLAVERIREHIAAGRCACEFRNPRGKCCLGDVIAALQRVRSMLQPRLCGDAVTGVADVS
jgi:hypothetical protein